MDQWHWSTLASNSKVSGDHKQETALQISVGSSRPPLSWVLAHQICHGHPRFLPKGWGGKHIFVCKACGKLGGSRGMLPRGNFDFGPFNLVESGTVFAQT